MANRQPDYTAYTVIDRGENADPWWYPIGAAFMNQDGEGYNVILQALPLDGKIVLRVPKPSSSNNDASQAQQTIREENDRRKGARREK